MNEKIKKQIDKFKKKSLISKIFDLLFYALLLALLIPATRKPVTSTLIKIISLPPRVSQKNVQKVSPDAYKWQLVDQNGKEVELSEFKDEVVLINLWATWCPPCIGEMPSFQKLHDEFGTKINFFFVTNEAPSKVKPFIDSKGYTIPVYYSKTQAPADFYSNSIPATYIVNKKGELVLSKKGAANWHSKSVKDLLEELIAE